MTANQEFVEEVISYFLFILIYGKRSECILSGIIFYAAPAPNRKQNKTKTSLKQLSNFFIWFLHRGKCA
jgi:hypothetical protein